MRRRLLVVLLSLACGFSLGTTSCAAESPTPPADEVVAAADPVDGATLADLSWLIGSWRRSARAVTIETWLRLSDNTFEGSSDRVDPKSGVVQFHEDLRLVAMGGKIFYIAKVDENPRPVAFTLVRRGPREASFENPAHDFPQRLIYRLSDDGQTLSVRVEGPGKDGETRGFDVVYSRSGD